MFYTFQLTAKIDKLSNESEDLRSKKRELESNVRKLENDMETVSQSNSELVIDFTKKNFKIYNYSHCCCLFTFQSIRIIEKEQQYKEVRTQVESMRVTYEKHQRELNERLERTVQEKSSMQDLTRALDEERRRVDELQVGECYSIFTQCCSIFLNVTQFLLNVTRVRRSGE